MRHQPSLALLKGKLFDDRGNPMTPSYAIKKGVRYRYYISCVLAQGRKAEAGAVPRVPAAEIEQQIVVALRQSKIPNPNQTHEPDHSEHGTDEDRALVETAVSRIVLHPGQIAIELDSRSKLRSFSNELVIDWTPQSTRRHRQVIAPATSANPSLRPIRAEARSRLVIAIAKARRWRDELLTGKAISVESIAQREDRSPRSIRMTLTLAFLAPDIVKAAINGTLPRGLGLSQMTDLSSDWSEQRRALGLQH